MKKVSSLIAESSELLGLRDNVGCVDDVVTWFTKYLM